MEKSSGDPDDFRVPLELAEGGLAERMGDLSVDPGVLNILVAQVVGDHGPGKRPQDNRTNNSLSERNYLINQIVNDVLFLHGGSEPTQEGHAGALKGGHCW